MWRIVILLVSVEQGVSVYYEDASMGTKTKIENFGTAGVKELHPGDSIVMVANVNIIFKSETIQEKLDKFIGVIDGIEKVVEGYKTVKSIFSVVDTAKKAMGGCLEAIMKFDQSAGEFKDKAELFKKLYSSVSSVAEKIDTGDNKVLAASAGLLDSGIKKTLDFITTDPEKWLRENSVEDIKELIGKIEGLNTAIEESCSGEEKKEEEKKFDIFDSLRTAISAIPVRFVLDNVMMSKADSNTADIAWTYSVSETDEKYFGVSNVSKYIDSLLKVIVSEGYSEFVPSYVLLIPGMDDPYDKEEAIKYIQATEGEIEKFKAKDTSGEVTFTAWIERSFSAYSLKNGESDVFSLSCDNETATYENGVLTFTGDGMISVVPSGVEDGILHIEDSEGNRYTYVIDVVEAHECVAGQRQIILAPTEETDGFGVVCCKECSEVMELVSLTAEDICEEHDFAEPAVRALATCTSAGVVTKECTVCGTVEYQFEKMTEHLGEWIVTKAPTAFVEGERELTCKECSEVLESEILPITRETFGYLESLSEGVLTGIPEGVTVEMLSYHYENMGLHITVTGADEFVGTGCRVYFGEAVYTVIVSGDVNGDGRLNAFDTNILCREMTGECTLFGDFEKAADLNGDNVFNSIDLNILLRLMAQN